MKNEEQNNTEGNSCFIIFITPFILIGIVTLYISLSSLYLQIKTYDWIPVEAQIEDVYFISTLIDDIGPGNSYETKCTYTYIHENKNYTNNIISPGYGENSTENHQELYEILEYTNVVTAYINPDKPNESTLAKGINSSATALLIFSILWNMMLITLWKKGKYDKIVHFMMIFFVCGIITIISGVLHTNFKKKINIIEKKSKEEIEKIEKELRDKAIKEYENEEKERMERELIEK